MINIAVILCSVMRFMVMTILLQIRVIVYVRYWGTVLCSNVIKKESPFGDFLEHPGTFADDSVFGIACDDDQVLVSADALYG